mmetsp:Transcript_19314/g.33297  ORF Transcript_19314/g.33297 Transcript_19314/m.33297 type:complete len:130 (-) Transcript_19314:994-1383(-)
MRRSVDSHTPAPAHIGNSWIGLVHSQACLSYCLENIAFSPNRKSPWMRGRKSQQPLLCSYLGFRTKCGVAITQDIQPRSPTSRGIGACGRTNPQVVTGSQHSGQDEQSRKPPIKLGFDERSQRMPTCPR